MIGIGSDVTVFIVMYQTIIIGQYIAYKLQDCTCPFFCNKSMELLNILFD